MTDVNEELEGAVGASFLGRLPADAVAPLLAGAERLVLPAGVPIVWSGPHFMGLIVSGLARAQRLMPDGRSLTQRYMRRGDVAGLGAGFYRDDLAIPRIGSGGANIQFVLDTVQYQLSAQTWRDVARRDVRVAYATLEEVSRIFRLSFLLLTDATLATMRQRVARELLLAADALGEDVVPLTQQQIAEGVGSAREVVARALGELRDTGAIATVKGGVAIRDGDALRAELRSA